MDVFREAFRGGRKGTVEYRIVRDDGTTRWINSRAAPVHLDDRVVGFVASASDVTDEVEARRSIDWVGQILAATPDYTVITNSSGCTVFMNQASRDLYGLGCDAAQGFLFSRPEPAARLTGLRPGSPLRT